METLVVLYRCAEDSRVKRFLQDVSSRAEVRRVDSLSDTAELPRTIERIIVVGFLEDKTPLLNYFGKISDVRKGKNPNLVGADLYLLEDEHARRTFRGRLSECLREMFQKRITGGFFGAIPYVSSRYMY
jgi:hypothetical protein